MHARMLHFGRNLLAGSMTFGMVDENSKDANQLILRNLSQYDTIHIPQGIVHFSFNDNCQPAAFLANFGTRDPGTQSIWNSIMQIPNSILHLSTGIPEANFNTYKQLPLILAPGESLCQLPPSVILMPCLHVANQFARSSGRRLSSADPGLLVARDRRFSVLPDACPN